MRRRGGTLLSVIAVVLGITAPAYACGGLVAPNGTINLLRTATLAAYVDGVEHYMTSFEFAGGGAEFGSIIPLPGIPSDVTRGGRWTLQRLQEEVAPPVQEDRDLLLRSAAGATADMAEVLLEKRIEALDITILKGGATEVGLWAKENGFALPPDSPEVLDFYAERSPIFMAARFDVKRAQELGQTVGDGTPIHLSIPTPNPWVPLRILGLGRQPREIIEADVFLLTESNPNLLPAPGSSDEARGVVLDRSEPASTALLTDLASDKGMKWLPTNGMHLSYIRVDARAADLTHDLAIDASGTGIPSRIAAGLASPPLPFPADVEIPWALWVLALAFGAAVLGFLTRGAMLE
jgi:Uncharacterized protein conserved in bacteria (DUF2330)